MLDKLSPTLNAALAIPVLLVISLPFAYIFGTMSIIATDNVAVGFGVGIAVAVFFALWASYGIYSLSNEVREEPGAESVSA
ncbi:MAG: hypothetical protein ACOCPZ_01700 [Natrialbaceae archaeon]